MIDRARIPREPASRPGLVSSPSTCAHPLPSYSESKKVSLKVHPLIQVPDFYSIHFSSSFPSTYLRGVFICSGFLFLVHWRFSQDNSSDKCPAAYKEGGGGERRKSLGRANFKGWGGDGRFQSPCPQTTDLSINTEKNFRSLTKKGSWKVREINVYMENVGPPQSFFWKRKKSHGGGAESFGVLIAVLKVKKGRSCYPVKAQASFWDQQPLPSLIPLFYQFQCQFGASACCRTSFSCFDIQRTGSQPR